jgi:hypothetical protein
MTDRLNIAMTVFAIVSIVVLAGLIFLGPPVTQIISHCGPALREPSHTPGAMWTPPPGAKCLDE